MENEWEYRYSYCLTFFSSLRLCSTMSNLIMPYFTSCLLLSILVFMHITSFRRKFLFECVLLLGLFSTSIYLDSCYMYILFCFHCFFPLFLKKVDNKNRFGLKSIIVQSLLTIMFYFIGFRNISSYAITKLFNKISFDIIKILQDLIHFEFIDELEIFTFLIKKFKSMSVNWGIIYYWLL